MNDKKKVARIAAIALSIAIVVVVVIILVVHQYNQYLLGPGHEDSHEEIPGIETQEEVAIYNQNTIDQIVGRERMVSQYRCLQQTFLLDDEKKTATKENDSPEGLANYYGATIKIENLKGYVMTPTEWTYYTTIELSDGRAYDWFLRLDTDYRYSYSVVKNPANGNSYYCTSGDNDIPTEEVTNWITNTLKIAPNTVSNFKY